LLTTAQGIAWPTDVSDKYKNPGPEIEGTELLPEIGRNFTDEDFIVWMRTAGLPEFKKLHRRIEHDLEPGDYVLSIDNTYPVWQFNGRKLIVLSTASALGGKNPFLGLAYIVVGIVCALQGVLFLIKHKTSPRRLGSFTRRAARAGAGAVARFLDLHTTHPPVLAHRCY